MTINSCQSSAGRTRNSSTTPVRLDCESIINLSLGMTINSCQSSLGGLETHPYRRSSFNINLTILKDGICLDGKGTSIF